MLKPFLNWENVCSRTQLEIFGEPSWFLIWRTFLREPSLDYSSNCDEAIFGVQKASLNMFWEHSLYSTNIASDWLRAEPSCGRGRKKEKREEKKKEKKRRKKEEEVSLGSSLASEGIFLIC